jgi:pilus assembly protein Flp/PilA
MRMWQKLAFTAKTFTYCQSGATAIEYGLIVSGIAVAILAAVNGIGTSMNATFKSISTQM